MELKTISDEAAARSIRAAKNRAVYATPGVTDTVAAALIEACGRLGRAKVRVVLDGSANALRLGYGHPRRSAVVALRTSASDLASEIYGFGSEPDPQSDNISRTLSTSGWATSGDN